MTEFWSDHSVEASDSRHRRNVEAQSLIPSGPSATLGRQANGSEKALKLVALEGCILINAQASIRDRLAAIPEVERPGGLRADALAVADPHFSVEADAAGGVIKIFAGIGPGSRNGVTADKIDGALGDLAGKPVTVKINSLGGDVFESVAIYNLFRAYAAPVTMQVLGVAASGASVIAMAGDRVEMARNSQLMIHNAHGFVYGEADDLEAAARVLHSINDGMADTYARRSAQPKAKVAALMKAETWFTAEDAVTLRFADRMLAADALPRPRVVAAAAGSRSQLEEQLRGLGFSRSAAKKVTAGGWPALAGAGEGQTPRETEIRNLVDRVRSATNKLSKEK